MFLLKKLSFHNTFLSSSHKQHSTKIYTILCRRLYRLFHPIFNLRSTEERKKREPAKNNISTHFPMPVPVNYMAKIKLSKENDVEKHSFSNRKEK
jgi:hypothetical protein